MTAREFLNYAGIKDTRANRDLLTLYLDSSVNYAEFPDAAIPDEVVESADEPASFQEFVEVLDAGV